MSPSVPERRLLQPSGARRVTLFVGLLACLGTGHATKVPLPLQSGGAYSVPVRSYTETRFHNTVRQQYDFSCGAAALATLLTHHYDRPVDEQSVFAAMFEQGDQARIRREGFSMLDMKNYLDAAGLRSDGFRITLDQLARLGLPAIALTNASGYLHFVVVKGVRDDEVLLGDPTLGLRRISRTRFEQGWNGVFFLIRDGAEQALASFNRDSEWGRLAHAPIGVGLNRTGIPDFSLSVTAGHKL